MSDINKCLGCYGPELPGKHLFDCPTRIRELEAQNARLQEALHEISNATNEGWTYFSWEDVATQAQAERDELRDGLTYFDKTMAGFNVISKIRRGE